MPADHPVTPDGRYLIVRRRLWRCTNPGLPPDVRARWVSALMNARRAMRRDTPHDQRVAAARAVDEAKRALGERGPVWWTDGAPDHNRKLVHNTPYAHWFATLGSRTETGDTPGNPGREPMI